MLTPEQWNTLRAAADRIVPADDFPGAWDAGVGEYLRRQFGRDLQAQVEAYRAGLDGLDAEAHASANTPFAALSAEAQDDLLRRVEAGTVATTWSLDPATFFRSLVEHVMEGYYSDPGNGGNRDGVAWKMIGFEVRG